jgi:cytochrome oxidase Cu insertion factor (SCO1/SenC/PrrC family)
VTSGRVPRRRQRRQLIGLALLFFAPLGLSFYLYYGLGTWRPAGRVNAGALIEPARPMPALALPLSRGGMTDAQFLKGKWTLLYVQQGSCGDDCRRQLYDMRQVRIALDRDRDRVQRVFIGDGDCCDLKALLEAHPDLIALRASPDDAPLLAMLPRGADARKSARVYLIDPLGNLMMFYTAGANPKGMLEDMKRLLGLSHIG